MHESNEEERLCTSGVMLFEGVPENKFLYDQRCVLDGGDGCGGEGGGGSDSVLVAVGSVDGSLIFSKIHRTDGDTLL